MLDLHLKPSLREMGEETMEIDAVHDEFRPGERVRVCNLAGQIFTGKILRFYNGSGGERRACVQTGAGKNDFGVGRIISRA